MKLIDYKKIDLLTFTPKYLEEYLLFYRYNCPTVTFHAIKLFVLQQKVESTFLSACHKDRL